MFSYVFFTFKGAGYVGAVVLLFLCSTGTLCAAAHPRCINTYFVVQRERCVFRAGLTSFTFSRCSNGELL